MREMGVATVNLLKEDAVIVSASQKAVSKYGQVTAPSSNDPEATELYDRYRSSPAIVELKDVVENCVLKFKPCNVQTAPPATLSAMRRALAKVVAADYALIHSMGDIRGKGKYSAQLAQYVYAVDPTAMKVRQTSPLPPLPFQYALPFLLAISSPHPHLLLVSPQLTVPFVTARIYIHGCAHLRFPQTTAEAFQARPHFIGLLDADIGQRDRS